MTRDPLVEQIADLLDRVADIAGLLGLDLTEQAAARVQGRADLYAAQLIGADSHVAADTAIDLAQLLPDSIPAEFWSTPLGAAMAATYQVAPTTVTVSEAAKILGVGRARAYQLAAAGKLARTEGGVTLASVLAWRSVTGRWSPQTAQVLLTPRRSR